jgi:hypothetical protein
MIERKVFSYYINFGDHHASKASAEKEKVESKAEIGATL